MVWGTTILRPRQERTLAPGPRFQRTPLWPSSTCAPSHQAEGPWTSICGASCACPSGAHNPPLDPSLGNRDARIPSSNRSNTSRARVVLSRSTFLKMEVVFICPFVMKETQCLGRLWTGIECMVWVILTHVEALHRSGWRQEWKRKKEWPQTGAKGRGPLLSKVMF